MLVRSGLDFNSVFQKNICGKQDFLTAVESISHVMQASLGARCISRVCKIVGLVGTSHPHSGLYSRIEHNLFRQAKSEVVLKEFAIRLDVYSETVPVVQATDIAAARRKTLSLILQRRAERPGRLILLRFIIKLYVVAVWIPAQERRTVAQIAISPSQRELGPHERIDAPL
jgi:hypothetical protein